MHRHRTPALLVVGLLALVLAASAAGGWFIASRATGERAEPGAGQVDPAEPPYEAGDAVAAPAATPPAPAPGEAAPAPSAAPPPEGTTGQTSSPAPQVPPAAPPRPSSIPAPAPPQEPAPAPEPDPATTPRTPPPAIGIAADALPAEGRSWSMLAAARRASAPGSQERADLDWLVAFARSALAPSQPAGRQETARHALRVNAWWFSHRGSPAERVIARDPEGVILTYKAGYGFTVNPVATLGRWRGLNDPWSATQLADAVIPLLAERTDAGRQWSGLEYFDVPGSPDAVAPGVSGMSQARAAALFATAWSRSADPRYLQAAQRVITSFRVPVDNGGARASVPDPAGGPDGIWFPERAYPGRPAWTGGALNGFMVTLIELRRTADALERVPPDHAASTAASGTAPAASTEDAGGSAGSPDPDPGAATATAASPHEVADQARSLAAQGMRSLIRFLPLHDSGNWSYYGLLTPGSDWRTDLADLNYHCYHVSLLRTLDGLYPGRALGATASRWQGYVDARRAACPAR